jgi:hypothetical protein
VTVTIQVTHNSVTLSRPSVIYRVLVDPPGTPARCVYGSGGYEATPTFDVVAPRGATIRLQSTSMCYSGRGVAADVVADATKTVEVAL